MRFCLGSSGKGAECSIASDDFSDPVFGLANQYRPTSGSCGSVLGILGKEPGTWVTPVHLESVAGACAESEREENSRLGLADQPSVWF